MKFPILPNKVIIRLCLVLEYLWGLEGIYNPQEDWANPYLHPILTNPQSLSLGRGRVLNIAKIHKDLGKTGDKWVLN
jgi:hypothetical protein